MRKRIAQVMLIVALIGLIPVFAVFGTDQARIVYIAGSGNGKRYHYEDCRTLKNSVKVEITVEDAKKRGYSPCGVCKPGNSKSIVMKDLDWRFTRSKLIKRLRRPVKHLKSQ